ncbi:MAG: hypothetical protein ACLGH3_00640 [Actinomycetota bacterium]
MKKMLAAAMLAAFAAAPMAAQAEPVVLAEGNILVGNPNGAVTGGVTEILEACNFGTGELQGVDGIAFEVPVEALNRPAALATSGAAAIDVDVYWYDSACGLIEDFSMGTLGEANESGTVPADAAYGVVNLIIGADADVRLTYDS